MLRGRAWTPEEDDVLRAGFAAGLAYAAIGKQVDRTRDAVSARMNRLGCILPRDEILRRRKEGWQRALEAGRVGGNYSNRAGKPGKPHTPETIARMSAIQKAMFANPERMAKHREAVAKGMRNRDKAAIGAKISATKLAWCPPHLVPAYRGLSHRNGETRIHAAEAKRMILDEWAKQLRRALRQIAAVAPLAIAEHKRHRNSFAGQLERVQSGARVVPSLRLSRLSEGDYSLTGNATALL
jgi:hypothetical protein